MAEQSQKTKNHSGIKSNAQETTSPDQIAAPAKSAMPPPLQLQAITAKHIEVSEEKAEPEQESEKSTIQEKKAIQAGTPENPGDDPNENNKASGFYTGDNLFKTALKPFQLKPDNSGDYGIAPENFSNQSFISATQKNTNQQPGENLAANIFQAKANNEAQVTEKPTPFISQFQSQNTRSTTGDSGIIQKMEGIFNTSFSDVSVHTNSSSATEAGALAYARGNDIHFAPGRYNPESQAGKQLIGHELAHVVQQKEGRVQPTVQLKSGIAVNDDPALEKEADELGAKAAQAASVTSSLEHSGQFNETSNAAAGFSTPAPMQQKPVVQRSTPGGQKKSSLPDKAPIAADLVSQHFSDLKLSEAHLKILQDCLDARLELKKLDEQLKEIGDSIESSKTQQREAIFAKMRPLYSKSEVKSISVPTGAVLANDFLTKDADLLNVKAFKEALYMKLISEPTFFKLGTGYEPNPIFTAVEWSQYNWPMTHKNGKITFEDAIRPQKFNLAYQRVIIAGEIDSLENMLEIRKEMGGIDPLAEGKKLGETYGHVWNSSINVKQKIGEKKGYCPDAEGNLDLIRDFESASGSRAVIVGSDKWSHIYQLDDFSVKELKGVIGDDYGYLLTNGAGVSATKVRTKDGFELSFGTGRTGTGWRYLQILSELEQFSIGAIIGDFSEDPTATELMGQIIMGVVPIAGQIADARDTVAAIKKMWQSGGKDGKVQFAFTLVAWIPLIGDGMKAAYKAGGKKAASNLLLEAVESQKGAFSKRLGKEIADDPTTWAKKFGLDDAAGEIVDKSIKDAVESGNEKALEKIAKELIETYTKSGNNVFAIVNKAGGKWKNVVKVLDNKSTEGTIILQQMEAYRIAQFEGMKVHLAKNVQKSSDVALSSPPKFERTGTPGYKSDYDGSFLGPNAGFYKERAEDYMSSRFGRDWRDTFDADIFTDPGRMHVYAEAAKNLPGGTAAAIEKRVIQDAELNVLAKMLNSNVELHIVAKKAAELGVDMATLMQRQKELLDISESYFANMLRRGHPIEKVKKKAKEMGVDFNNVLKKEKDGSSAILEMELKLDSLHTAYLAAKDTSKRAQLAEEMALLQGKLNASIPGPYMTPGGVMKHTTRRDRNLRNLLDGTEFTPSMAYMQVLDDYYMLVTALPKDKFFDEKAAKSFAKYADRLMVTAGRFGAVDAGAASARGQFDDIFALLQRARLEGKMPDINRVQQKLNVSSDLLRNQINSIEKSLKESSDKYVGEIADQARRTADESSIRSAIKSLANAKANIAKIGAMVIKSEVRDDGASANE